MFRVMNANETTRTRALHPIAQRISLDPSPTLRLNERVKALWAEGEEVSHLGFGESRFPVHPKLRGALADNSHRKAYLPTQGLPELREAVAAYYAGRLGCTFAADQVIIAPGSKALLFALQMALDADLLLPSPSWVSYAPQAKLLGKPCHAIPATAESGYDLTIEALAGTLERAQSEYKVLIINSPNNPTGRMLSASFLEELAIYCRKNNVIVLSDEIYGRVSHGPQHLSLAKVYPEGTVVVGGLSKHLSLGGWRLGHAVVPALQPHLTQALVAIGSEIWSSASAPIQYAALTAYSGDSDIETYITTCTELHALRTAALWRGLRRLSVRCPEPQGGFYLFPDFNAWRGPLAERGVHTSTDLAAYLLEHHRLATLPGESFGLPESDLSLRLSASFIDLETDEKAAHILHLWQTERDEVDLIQNRHPGMQEVLAQFETFIAELNADI